MCRALEGLAVDTYKIKHAEADQALYCHIDPSPLHGCCSFLHVAEHTDVKNKKEGTKSEAQAYHRTFRERLLFSVTSNKRNASMHIGDGPRTFVEVLRSVLLDTK